MESSAVEPLVFVILGGTGDLAARKLIPALYRLKEQGLLSPATRILGVSQASWDDARYRNWVGEALARSEIPQAALKSWCEQCIYYQPIGSGSSRDYEQLLGRLQTLEQAFNLSGNRVFY